VSATDVQIAEAVRLGPYVMPRFTTKAITDRQLDSIVRYVDWVKHPDNRGGWAIGDIGPVPEGLVTWFLAAALLVAICVAVGKRLVVTEELVEPYPPAEHPGEQELIVQLVEESGDRITRRRLFKLGLGAAGGTLGLAALAPALSFGPLFQTKYFRGTPWRKGTRLVDESSRP